MLYKWCEGSWIRKEPVDGFGIDLIMVVHPQHRDLEKLRGYDEVTGMYEPIPETTNNRLIGLEGCAFTSLQEILKFRTHRWVSDRSLGD